MADPLSHLYGGMSASYREMRRFTDMQDARNRLAFLLRQAADDIDMGRIQADGTPLVDEEVLEII
jgi:hypothetical protein